MKNTPNFHPEALEYLETWFARHEPAWIAQGAEPDEVRADIRSAIAERFDGASSIEGPELRELLEAMAPPASPASETSKDVESQALPVCRPGQTAWYARDRNSSGQRPGIFRQLLGLLKPENSFWLFFWPATVVIVELIWHVCGGLFFDPMPTYAHLGAIVLAVLTGGLVWRHERREKTGGGAIPSHRFLLGTLRGFSMVASGYCAILQIPLLVLGTFYFFAGVIMSFGMGLVAIPFYVLAAMAAAAPLQLFLGLRRHGPGNIRSLPVGIGLLLGLLGLVALEGPAFVTRLAGEKCSPGFLRAFGSERTLLKLCYEGEGGRRTMTDTSGFMVGLLRGNVFDGMARSGDVEKWRLMYYRVTGRAFNAQAPPSDMIGTARNAVLFADLEWDSNLGGDGVFARLRGLDLCSSRLDGHVDAASGLGYWEWTMEFENITTESKEARMQVLLPPGAVMSKLTLWVNGQPQEAAFAGGDVVAKAYKQIAVVQRKDPVLARWVGPDRVFIQCFPVLPAGKMKIRLGVSAPLDAGGRLFFPRFLEQNFGYADGLATDLWVQGDTRLQVDGIENGSKSGDWKEVHGSLPITRQAESSGCVSCPEATEAPVVWARDPFTEAGQEILVRHALPDTSGNSKISDKIVLVVDTSRPLEKWKETILEAIRGAKESGILISAVVAVTDDGARLVEPAELRDLSFEGGKDNRSALMLAIDTALSGEAGGILWLHGPQPVEFGSTEGVQQLLERAFQKPRMVSIELEAGPNRLLEKLGGDQLAPISRRIARPEDLLPAIRLEARPISGRYEYHRLPLGQKPEGAREVWDQLARLHVWQSVRQAKGTPGMGALAARYQLVTPLSGAVVLETREQFDQHGLKQVDASSTPSIPSIPEPGTSALLVTTILFTLRRKR